MKTYKVEKVRVAWTRNSSDTLRQATEDKINEMVRQGYTLEQVDFELMDQGGYIYSFIIFSI